ncbi:sigma-70 family RNA polymerase sigma factor [Streptomyces sp. NPDC023588]|uniref:RNA polymerase sigma factor n=1 Tax=Streptomyces sp. NPDC023588 TaxID=3154907 RepID=UPI0033CFB670
MTHGTPTNGGGPEDSFGRRFKSQSMDGWGETERKSYWAFQEAMTESYLQVAYIKLGSDADAEEAVIKAFDYILANWQRMLGMEYLNKYAWTVLNRRIIDQQRARRRRPEPADVAPFEAVLSESDGFLTKGSDAFDYLLGTIHFYTAVRRLSERQRDAVILYYGLDYSTRDTALVMGVEEATVRSQLSQARARLLRFLGAPTNPPIEDGKVRE